MFLRNFVMFLLEKIIIEAYKNFLKSIVPGIKFFFSFFSEIKIS